MWETIIHNVPNSCCWLVAGDFNLVEIRQDKTNQCERLMILRERDAFTSRKHGLL